MKTREGGGGRWGEIVSDAHGGIKKNILQGKIVYLQTLMEKLVGWMEFIESY
jgi:hypothetical protein